MSIALISDRRPPSDLVATGRWRGPAGSIFVHGAIACVILAWPAPDLVIEPATIVEAVLADPAPPPAPADVAEQPAPVVPAVATRQPAPAAPRPRPAARPLDAAVQAAASDAAAPVGAATDNGPAAPVMATPVIAAASAPSVVEVLDAVPVSRPKPFYPRIARLRGWQGVVVVHVAIDESGRAWQVTIRDSSGHPVLDDVALDTVRQWRFSPARQGGRAVASAIEVPIRFSLTDG
jgi:protein TonB